MGGTSGRCRGAPASVGRRAVMLLPYCSYSGHLSGARVRARVRVRVRVRDRREMLTCLIRGSNSVTVFVTSRRYRQTNSAWG